MKEYKRNNFDINNIDVDVDVDIEVETCRECGGTEKLIHEEDGWITCEYCSWGKAPDYWD